MISQCVNMWQLSRLGGSKRSKRHLRCAPGFVQLLIVVVFHQLIEVRLKTDNDKLKLSKTFCWNMFQDFLLRSSSISGTNCSQWNAWLCSEPRNPRVEFFPKSQLSVCTLVCGKDIWVLKQHRERGVICMLYMISIVSFLVIYTCMYRYVDMFYSYIHLPPCPLSLYVWRDLTNH